EKRQHDMATAKDERARPEENIEELETRPASSRKQRQDEEKQEEERERQRARLAADRNLQRHMIAGRRGLQHGKPDEPARQENADLRQRAGREERHYGRTGAKRQPRRVRRQCPPHLDDRLCDDADSG